MARLLALVCGESKSGKTTSLRTIKDPEKVFYLSTEANKGLTFAQKGKKFKTLKSGLQHPSDIFTLFEQVEKMDDIDTIIVDSLTYLMDMVESQIVLQSDNKMGAWGEFQQYFKKLMQEVVGVSEKNWIFLAHLQTELMPSGDFKYTMPIKGALKGNGVESYFNNVIYTRTIKVTELENIAEKLNVEWDSNMYSVTANEKMLNQKHVFQTNLTEDYVYSRISSPIGCFEDNQIFMDNDMQKLIDHLEEYYGYENP